MGGQEAGGGNVPVVEGQIMQENVVESVHAIQHHVANIERIRREEKAKVYLFRQETMHERGQVKAMYHRFGKPSRHLLGLDTLHTWLLI